MIHQAYDNGDFNVTWKLEGVPEGSQERLYGCEQSDEQLRSDVSTSSITVEHDVERLGLVFRCAESRIPDHWLAPWAWGSSSLTRHDATKNLFAHGVCEWWQFETKQLSTENGNEAGAALWVMRPRRGISFSICWKWKPFSDGSPAPCTELISRSRPGTGERSRKAADSEVIH